MKSCELHYQRILELIAFYLQELKGNLLQKYYTVMIKNLSGYSTIILKWYKLSTK